MLLEANVDAIPFNGVATSEATDSREMVAMGKVQIVFGNEHTTGEKYYTFWLMTDWEWVENPDGTLYSTPCSEGYDPYLGGVAN